ncbi:MULTISPECIES: conjugal transfer protein TraG [unclassified Novosphingobium]|uniref:conjugal transfer protein TraG n=1 Tax=unclassified Novosphingobium TaxID=2644732 RepID=UPI00086E4AAF|nr:MULTISPECIES: conjugal transfer protein TraG [unclassified Novosphingobium]MBN9146074.1 conjugal transfer protein TraG [Novosphingobium sp.]MDR6709385.1 type IV secretion system protein VirD4 [Novosphingobium sp. 1748]ODU80237.1 MAG: conjugal transfer protein TraG [Novosphingobium sp. SCN 63-17]OJX94162.1 MAG: conjugal transfer protein TraG [Novosphingobium sp. 63-713]
MTPTKLLIGQIFVVFAIVLAGVWLATQWAAAALAYQPELGRPWFSAFGHPIYQPWALFGWWFSFEAYAPAIFEEAGAIAAASGLIGCAAAIFGSVWRARQQRNVTTYGSARWATVHDMRAAGLLNEAGVFLGRTGPRYLRHDGPEHIMAFAPTRSGKGIGLVVPTLLGWSGSTVIHDIKGENWQLTAGWRQRFSHCLLFNPTDARSARYNPLLEVRRGTDEVRDVQNIADILVDPEGALERRNHWEKTSHSLLVGAILHILYAEEEKTLARVASFLSDPQRPFTATLRRMMTTNHLGTAEAPMVHPVVASAAREVLNKSENERSGVLSTAMSFLGLYRDPTVATVTSRCDWRIADLVEGKSPVSLYLVVPPSDISRTKPLIRLVLNQIGRRLTEHLHAENGANAGARHKLLMMLDEFPALGRLDFFETSLAFLAGYGVRAFLIAQSLNQIEKAYGEHNAILDNCHVRVAFATNDERTARRISDALGTATEQRAMRNYAGHRLAPWLAHVMVSRQETGRALLTPGEVMQPPATDELVLVSGTPPIRATKLRYFEDSTFKARILPPPTLASGDYVDRPAARADVWADSVRNTDARLGAGEDNVDGGAGGGLEQARQPGQEIDPPLTPDPVTTDPLGLGADDDDAVAYSQAMDQARALGTARSVYGIEAGAPASHGHRPDDLQLDF